MNNLEDNSGKRLIAVNVISSAIQVVIVGLVYFFIYRILVKRLGVEVLGIWSLIVAISSISGVANFGFQSAIVKYVAEFKAKGEFENIANLLKTSILSLIFIFIILALLIFILSTLFISKLVDSKYISTVVNLLPLILSGLFLNAIAGALTSTLEGFQKNYIRNFTYSFVSLLYLVLALVMVPRYGLIGLAFSQLIQSFFVLIVALYFINKKCFLFNLFSFNWDRELFKTSLKYGYKMQIVSIFQLLVDPLVKILLSRIEGITTLGYYEMANKFILQIRQIIAGMSQVTIPIVSHYVQIDKFAVKSIYLKSFSLLIFVLFPLFAAILFFAPHLSVIWLGRFEPVFVNIIYILAIGMVLNILCAPAYFNSLGEGELNGVLYNSLIVLILVPLLSITIGQYIPGYGIVTAYAISSAIGSFYLIFYYHRKNKLGFKGIVKASELRIIISSLVFGLASIIIFRRYGGAIIFNLKTLIIFIILYLMYFLPWIYFNENFKLLGIRQYLKVGESDD